MSSKTFNISGDITSILDVSDENKPHILTEFWRDTEEVPFISSYVSFKSILDDFIKDNSIPSDPPKLTKEYYMFLMKALNFLDKEIKAAKNYINKLEIIE